jgi:hypothetical protein
MTNEMSHDRPDDGQERQDLSFDSVPEDLESSGAKLVYLAVKVSEDPTTSELADMLQMKSLTLYPLLRTLSERGHLESDGDTLSCT